MLLRLVRLLSPNGAIGLDLDPGVYYGTVGLLVAGHLPYADFVLVQPPGILLLLAPIAWLGEHVTGHASAFVLASALSAVAAGGTIFGIGTLAARWRGSAAGIVAALLYATFLPAVIAEGEILLEPFVNVLFVATALIWLSPISRAASHRRLLVSGVLIALATLVKVTGVVAGIGCIVAGPFRRPWVERAILCAAVSGAGLAIVAPFIVGAGVDQFFDQVVVTQIGRPRGGGDPGDLGDPAQRVLSMLGVGPLAMLALVSTAEPRFLFAMALFVPTLGLTAWAWLRGGVHGRFWSATWISSAGLLMAAPSYYYHYALTLMVSTAVLLAATTPAISSILGRRGDHGSTRSFVAAIVLVLPAVAVIVTREVDSYPRTDPGATIRAMVPRDSCVYTNPPSLNIAAGRLPPAGTDNPLADPFGEPLSLAVTVSGPYRSIQDAMWSSRAQDRMRLALAACPFVALVGPVAQQRYLSPATRAWFADHFDTIVEPTANGVGLWGRR